MALAGLVAKGETFTVSGLTLVSWQHGPLICGWTLGVRGVEFHFMN